MRVPFAGSIMIAWPSPIDDRSTPGGEALGWPRAISRAFSFAGHCCRNFILEPDVPTAHITVARRINRLLQPHSKIDDVDQHLNGPEAECPHQ